MLGRETIARAKPTRCCCPPESSETRRPAKSARPTSESASVTLDFKSLRSLRARRGNATFSKTVRCGQSAKSWNTNPILRFSGGRLRPKSALKTGLPSKRISPASGVSNPAIIRRSVVLPHPDGPRSVVNARLLNSMVSGGITVTPWKDFVMPRSAILMFCFQFSNRHIGGRI